MNKLKNSILYFLLLILPKNALSCLVGGLVGIELPKAIATWVNKTFAKLAGVDLSESEKTIEEYPTLQAFFTRRLKPNSRPLSSDLDCIISPADGFITMAGPIEHTTLIQAKGRYYDLRSLLANYSVFKRFVGGHYATIYLSPKDYHRFHAPLSGTVEETIYVPGALWPVNRWSVENVKELFCENERFITIIRDNGLERSLAHIAVGACMVGRIDLFYDALSNSVHGREKFSRDYQTIEIERGQELGQFMFGSTIILLFEPGLIEELCISAPCEIKMGQAIARFSNTK